MKVTSMLKNKTLLLIGIGIVIGAAIVLGINYTYITSSTNASCNSCHMHPHAEVSWKKSVHYNSSSGTKVDCAECHLPPAGDMKRVAAKIKIGVKDVISNIVNDSEDIDWEAKRTLEYTSKIVYNESCTDCHVQLFPKSISKDGITAHFYYEQNSEKLNLQCISCHKDVGHYDPNYTHSKMQGLPSASKADSEIYTQAAVLDGFKNYTEYIPGTSVKFNMIAIPGGTFPMGSPKDEPFRADNEPEQVMVQLSPFYMAEVEVTWDQYWAFYAETMSEARTAPEEVIARNASADLDAIAGATAPFGNPEQGWGGGDRPAITMTHYGAEIFCKWLSLKTGKEYRLPTEAEWEYAARGGTTTPYFFEGSPKKFSEKGFMRKFIAADTAVISRYVTYKLNSNNRTEESRKMQANPFGLKGMLGNVMEYTSDRYSDDTSYLTDGIQDPQGPESGQEWVVKGGAYYDDASDVRAASRRPTEHANWLKTDPQQPKSIWWYSDIKGIGFRVVCRPQ